MLVDLLSFFMALVIQMYLEKKNRCCNNRPSSQLYVMKGALMSYSKYLSFFLFFFPFFSEHLLCCRGTITSFFYFFPELKIFLYFSELYISTATQGWISWSGILQLKKQQVQMVMHYKISSSAKMMFLL